MAMIHMEPQTLQLFERVLGTLKPPPNLTLSQLSLIHISEPTRH